MEKIEVNGADCHPIYKYLRKYSELFDHQRNMCGRIPWNYAKFIVSGDGRVLSYHNPKVEPNTLRP